jgi:hypothetical protein
VQRNEALHRVGFEIDLHTLIGLPRDLGDSAWDVRARDFPAHAGTTNLYRERHGYSLSRDVMPKAAYTSSRSVKLAWESRKRLSKQPSIR